MINNPFSSKTFATTWVKHFRSLPQVFSFPFLNGISFYKHPFLPLYTNVGRNMTKGMMYSIDPEKTDKELKNKVLLIYDVPKYLETTDSLIDGKLKREKITQYPGFLLKLEPFKDYNDYMLQTFSKSSRYKLNKYKKRLESSFDIRYVMYHGEMDKEEYDFVFEHFENLLRKRFLQKQITNNNLEPKEWNFYKEATYPMILEKDAALFVIYDGDQIIGATLNYVHNNNIIDAITVFDIDYSKFHLGSVNIMKLIEWCIENQYDKLDFSKGYFDYKKRWCNLEYKFEYHLIYDRQAILSSIIAVGIKNYFQVKQFLRDKKLNEKLHELTFALKNKTPKENISKGYSLQELTEADTDLQLKEISVSETKYDFLKIALFDYLYLNNESIKDIRAFKVLNTETSYILQGKNNKAKVQLDS